MICFIDNAEDNDFTITVLKNILECIFMGIYITMFTQEMGDANYFNDFKVNSNISRNDVKSPI